MKFSPLDVRHQEFPSRFGGYERVSVREFLHELSDHLENLLRNQQTQKEYIAQLERELEEKKQAQEEIGRAVQMAERVGHEMKENAARESDLMIAQANMHRENIVRDTEARSTELEARHQARVAALEAVFRNRFAELERDHHQLELERDRVQSQRLLELERQFTERHTNMTTHLVVARQEYAQFVSHYKALAISFNDLASRHSVPEESPLPMSRLPVSPIELPPANSVKVTATTVTETNPKLIEKALNSEQKEQPTASDAKIESQHFL